MRLQQQIKDLDETLITIIIIIIIIRSGMVSLNIDLDPMEIRFPNVRVDNIHLCKIIGAMTTSIHTLSNTISLNISYGVFP